MLKRPQRGFTIALLGPDGAGKTTVARRLEDELDRPIVYLYMGVSAGSSNKLLLTTRLAHGLKRARGAVPDTTGPRPALTQTAKPASLSKRIRSAIRAGLRLANRLAEEWYRQLLTAINLRRGSLVVFDRHFFADYHAYDISGTANRSLSRRLHGLILSHLYPKPDLALYLDAPPEVLLARKGEGTLETLAQRRQDYLGLAGVLRNFEVVDATQSEDEVVRRVANHIRAFDFLKTSGAK